MLQTSVSSSYPETMADGQGKQPATMLTKPDIHTLYKAGGGDVTREHHHPPVDYAGKGSKLSYELRTFEIRIQNPNNAVEILDISKLNSHLALTSTERNLNEVSSLSANASAI